jgi:hypothetical protein
MTLPDERYRAIQNARSFLRRLLDPAQTKRVPKTIRQQAYWVLKHFPGEYDMELAAAQSPDVFGEPDRIGSDLRLPTAGAAAAAAAHMTAHRRGLRGKK